MTRFLADAGGFAVVLASAATLWLLFAMVAP